MTKFEIKIDGMGCEKCVKNIEEAFAGDPRVKGYEVKVGEAIVYGDLNKASISEIIDNAGYDLLEAKEI
ncbi:heavy-metal-associated domain-containing protein [Clostridium sp. Ade.TY]|uniref:heavy-metal-associated domain-containing protein n=1 Tax=Clostridium sp. Ade.TY TaxID=1391647 RepID=UPI00042002E3|nr:heavy-metal-associated domain-containing protein [Clostridium sp. Ade.TY]